ncbi:MAG: site-2 protease family protein [Gemmataceae bacterium]
MLLGGDAPTPLDLRFRLGPFPVRVSSWFWLIMALFGDWVFQSLGPVYLLIWVACGFVSILIHELGHAVMIRTFGSPSAITLHGFGGYAEMPYPPTAAWKRMVIALAGPAAGFTLFGVVFAVQAATDPAALPKHLSAALLFLYWMTLFWNLFNLLPVFQLDGGRVFREVCAILRARNPDAITHVVSVGVAGVIAAYSVGRMVGVISPNALPEWLQWLRPGLFMTVWFVLLAVENYKMYQAARRQYSPRFYGGDDDTPPWRRR